MNPKRFVALNHFTVPVAMSRSSRIADEPAEPPFIARQDALTCSRRVGIVGGRSLDPHRVAREPSAGRQTVKMPHRPQHSASWRKARDRSAQQTARLSGLLAAVADAGVRLRIANDLEADDAVPGGVKFLERPRQRETLTKALLKQRGSTPHSTFRCSSCGLVMRRH